MKKRSYWYNPLKSKDSHPALNPAYGLTFDRDQFYAYTSCNKRLRKELRGASSTSGVMTNNLIGMLNAICQLSVDFCTTAGHKAIAEKSGLSVPTVQRGISGMAKAGILLTFHRTRGDGPTKRRTTSLTILSGFCAFVRWLSRATPLNITKIGQIQVLRSAGGKISFDSATGEVITAPNSGYPPGKKRFPSGAMAK